MCAGWVVAHFSDRPAREVALDANLLVEAQVRSYETLGHDCLYGYADPLYIPEAFGCGVRYLRTGPVVDPLPISIKTQQDVERLPRPDVKTQGRLPVVMQTIQGLADYAGGRLAVVGLFEGPFTSLCRVIETEQIMRMTRRNGPLLTSLLERMTDFLVAFGRALVDSGANVLFVPEPTASSTMISPAMFREFALPFLQRITGAFDTPCILHICGDSSPIIASMDQTGAKVLSIDQCMDLQETRKKVPEAVLGGNVDPSSSLALGGQEKVIADTLRCLRTGGTKRYILMTGCGIPPTAPVENVKTMINTAKEYGLGSQPPDPRS